MGTSSALQTTIRGAISGSPAEGKLLLSTRAAVIALLLHQSKKTTLHRSMVLTVDDFGIYPIHDAAAQRAVLVLYGTSLPTCTCCRRAEGPLGWNRVCRGAAPATPGHRPAGDKATP